MDLVIGLPGGFSGSGASALPADRKFRTFFELSRASLPARRSWEETMSSSRSRALSMLTSEENTAWKQWSDGQSSRSVLPKSFQWK